MRYDVVYEEAYRGPYIKEHFCRVWEGGEGCYGTNPDHGVTFEEAKAEVIKYWENATEESLGLVWPGCEVCGFNHPTEEHEDCYEAGCYCNEDQGGGYTYKDEHGDCDYCLYLKEHQNASEDSSVVVEIKNRFSVMAKTEMVRALKSMYKIPTEVTLARYRHMGMSDQEIEAIRERVEELGPMTKEEVIESLVACLYPKRGAS